MSRCLLFIFFLPLAGQAFSSDTEADERSLWQLERAGWYYVEKNDLAAYSNLWHENFLSWPSLSAVPIRKDHVTDWITSETSKGHVFKLDEFKPAELKVTGDVAFAAYWITFRWLDKDGKGAAHTVRVSLTRGFAADRIGGS